MFRGRKLKKQKEAEAREQEQLRLAEERREAFNKVVTYDWSGRNYPR